MRILFNNVGNRHLIVKGDYDWVGENGLIKKQVFKQKTKEILDNFDNWKNKIQLNILDKLNLNNFDKIYLIGTNQGKNDEQDTIYAAEILKKFLGLDNIDILQFTTNPTDRKSTLYYFKKVFEERVGKDDEVVLLTSGGVPAMKDAMIWAGLSEELDIRIIEVNEKTGEIIESNIEQIYLKEIYKKVLKQFIKNYDWYGAQRLLEENQRLFGDAVDFLNKLKYVSARFNFDFDSANEILKNIKLTLAEEDIFIKLDIKNDEEGIKELLDNIEITYNKGEYTMLLGKVFRLQEAGYRYIFEKITGVSTKKDENKGFEEFVNYVSSNEELKNYLISEEVNYQQPNTYVLTKILKFFEEKKLLYDEDKKFYGILSSLDKLKDIRNNSIMAHGWKGVSKEDIDKVKLVDKINSIKKLLKTEGNIFDDMNKFLLKQIKTI